MTSRPAAPESETPETDAVWEEVWRDEFMKSLPDTLYDHARSLERRLSIAQTEIKGHMRVAKEVRVDALEEAAKACDAYKEKLLSAARAAPDGFAIVGYRQITAEYLAAAIRSLKSRA